MRHALAIAVVVGTLFGSACLAQGPNEKAPDFSFGDVKYFHRYSKADLHEYTPKGQEDLKAWKDMVSITAYPKVKDGDGLAGMANSVLTNYKAAGGQVVRTNSVPRTPDKPAEHLIAVIFNRDDFSEAAFARFRMHEGVGTSVVYSHRIWGKSTAAEMKTWIGKNGPATEKTLMAWNAMPKLPAVKE
jgi:hypothetical protein